MTQISILIGLETIFSLHMLPESDQQSEGQGEHQRKKKDQASGAEAL